MAVNAPLLAEYYDAESSPADALGRAARRLDTRGAMYLGGGVGCEKQADGSYMVTKDGKPSRKAGGPLSAVTHGFIMAGGSTAPDTPGGAVAMSDPAAAARMRELDGEVADAKATLNRHRERLRSAKAASGIGIALPSPSSDYAARAVTDAQARIAVARRERARLLPQPMAESAKTAALSVTHAPIGKGGTNWITKTKPGNTGQLPAYIQNVRNAIMRDGTPESRATAIAIGRTRDWAEGKGRVGAEVRAAAAKAIAEWEALRAKSHAMSGTKRVGKLAASDHDYDGHHLDALAEALLAGPFMALLERDFTAAQRRALAAKDWAMPDGSFPVETVADLKKALQAMGRAAEDKRAAVMAFLRRRAKQLGATNLVQEASVVVASASPEALLEADVMFGAGAPAAAARARTGSSGRGGGSGTAWNPSKHPRAGKGSPGGGKFIGSGASGSDVRSVQRGVGAKVDGQFGGITQQKVMAFQRAHGLQVDGVVGHQTALALAGSYHAARQATPGQLRKGDLARVQKAKAPQPPHAHDRKMRSGGGLVV